MLLQERQNKPILLPADGYFIMPKDEAALRELCRKSIDRDLKGFKPIEVIHGVGAHGALKLCGAGRDNQFVSSILTYWLRSGIPIDPNFDIRIFNYAVSPENYLDNTEQCDASFMCFLRGKNGSFEKARPHNADLEAKREKIIAETSWVEFEMRQLFFHVVAPNHSQEKWQRRVEQSGARIVATYGGQNEISTSWLATPNLIPIIDTPNVDFNHETQVECAIDLYGYETDIPCKWGGVMVRSDAVNDLAGLVNDKTEMAHQIRSKSTMSPESLPALSHPAEKCVYEG